MQGNRAKKSADTVNGNSANISIHSDSDSSFLRSIFESYKSNDRGRTENDSYISAKALIEEQNKALDAFKNEYEKRIDALDIKIKDAEKQIHQERNNILGSLTLFVSFFTFISININIFSKVDNLLSAFLLMFGQILLLLCLMSAFFLYLGNSGNNQEDNKTKYSIGLTMSFLFFLLCSVLFLLILFFNNPKLSPSIDSRVNELEKRNDKIYESISKEVELQILKNEKK